MFASGRWTQQYVTCHLVTSLMIWPSFKTEAFWLTKHWQCHSEIALIKAMTRLPHMFFLLGSNSRSVEVSWLKPDGLEWVLMKGDRPLCNLSLKWCLSWCLWPLAGTIEWNLFYTEQISSELPCHNETLHFYGIVLWNVLVITHHYVSCSGWKSMISLSSLRRQHLLPETYLLSKVCRGITF